MGMRNIIVGQSGGPTSVINSSLAGPRGNQARPARFHVTQKVCAHAVPRVGIVIPGKAILAEGEGIAEKCIVHSETPVLFGLYFAV